MSSSGYRISERRRNAIFERDGNACQLCGETDRTKLTLDHIVPRAFGGPTTDENLRVACHACNQSGARVVSSRINGQRKQRIREDVIRAAAGGSVRIERVVQADGTDSVVLKRKGRSCRLVIPCEIASEVAEAIVEASR